jgi:serine/threonine protein kinase
LLTELCDCNLEEFINEQEEEELSLNIKINIVKQLIEAVLRMQEMGVAHRDLKPDNILMRD